MRTKNILATIFSLTLAALAVAAQDDAAPKLPDTQAGRRVAAYLQAFNSGDEQKMREFLTSNVSPDALRHRPVEARLDVYRNMRGRLGAITLRRVVSAADSSVVALFESERGEWAQIGFDFEPEPPHRFLALRVEDAQPPATSAKPVSPAPPAPPLSETEAVAAVEKLVNERVAADEFSGVVLVTRAGQTVFKKAYGLASKEYDTANRPDTKFNLGSINKIFTAVAVGQLIESGKLSLDDKLGKHLPDYPNRDAAAKVTVRHLLSMSAGIGDFFGPKFESAAKGQFRQVKDYLPLFAAEPLQFEPGTKQKYSNGGYIVLGALIEKVTGQNYYDYIREHIFKPAGMNDTEWFESDRVTPNLASGYTREGAGAGGRLNNIYLRPAKGSPAGGGYATAEDLNKFALALLGGKLRLPPDGMVRQKEGGGFDSFGIAGGAEGINAMLFIGAGDDYTIIVLSNYDPPSAEVLWRQIRETLRRVKKG